MTVVIAAEGYPGSPARGDQLTGLDDAQRTPGAYVLQAGTQSDGAGHLVSAGGRVVNVVGSGPDLAAARTAAYQAAGKIQLRGGWFRTDIAERAAAQAARG